jgi:hypothetical protein
MGQGNCLMPAKDPLGKDATSMIGHGPGARNPRVWLEQKLNPLRPLVGGGGCVGRQRGTYGSMVACTIARNWQPEVHQPKSYLPV